MKENTLQEVWWFVKQNPKSTVGQVAKGLKISYNTAKKYVAHLCETNDFQYIETPYRKNVTTRRFFLMDDIPF